jgi:NADH:ubiquinone oxidoreductase subunit 5 (subunit L)/multisubunit Na+/H+ antiporter MnhA subunit
MRPGKRIGKQDILFIAVIVAALAISGVPGFAAFFSKDMILEAAWMHGHTWLWLTGIIAAGAAEAQVRSDVKQYYWQSYEAPNQQRQYREYRDSVAPSYACSEQRYTSQACWTDESGEQRCQTATGRSAQSCQ